MTNSIEVPFSETFERCFELVIGSEGGYTNNPKDPGGETKYGISKRAYPEVDIVNLTEDLAKAIYYRDYYQHTTQPTDTFDIAYPIFDTAVLHGVSFTRNLLKNTAQKKSPNFQEEFLTARALAEQADRNWSTFGTGWTRRLISVLVTSIAS